MTRPTDTSSLPHPGVYIQEHFLRPLGISPAVLAQALHLPAASVVDLLSGQARLDAEFASRLGSYLQVPAKWFLALQAEYDATLVAENLDIAPFLHLEDFLVTPKGVRPMVCNKAHKPAPTSLRISPEFEARLREQAKYSQRRIEREPVLVTQPDGTTILTGK